MLLGGNDSAPQWVVVVQAPLDVTTVRIVFADGSIDAAAPQNGVAVLTGPGQPVRAGHRRRVHLLDGPDRRRTR